VRCLIIGCGCRGLMLTRELIGRGDSVRATTRDPGRLAEIEAAGAEAVLADPDRVGTLVGAFEHVTVACILLGSATGSPDLVDALHATRLEMLLTKMVDTTVRGVVYEARGAVDPATLARGVQRVGDFAERASVQCVMLDADPSEPSQWLRAAVAAVDQSVAPRLSPERR
jgi:threonine dehydrogenase-like Zn-dependent dehydrogenase